MNTTGTYKLVHRLRLNLVLIISLATTSLLMLHLLTIHTFRDVQAEFFVRGYRRTIIAGEKRDFLVAATHYKKEFFDEVVFQEGEMQKPLNGINTFIKGEILKPIHYDEQKRLPMGHVKFKYNPFYGFSITLLIAAIVVAITLFMGLRLEKLLIRDHRKDLELRKNKTISATMQMIAHDVRKPFQMLHRLLDLLQRSSSEQESKEILGRFISPIHGALNSIEGMLEEVMQLDRPMVVNKERVDCGDILNSLMEQCALYRPGVERTLQLRHSLLVLGDRLQLTRLFANVLNNAFEAVNDGGEVWIRSEDHFQDKKAEIHIHIGNTGSFVEPRDRARIFELFYTQGKAGGTGLGLAIAKKLVTNHAGKIRCYSHKLHGTEFVIRLPGVKEGREVLSKTSGEKRPWVVVDDCPLTTYSWRKLLPQRVLAFTSPREFLEQIETEPDLFCDVEVFILDQFFSEDRDFSGTRLAKALRARGLQQPIVLSSALAVEDLDVALISGQVSKDPSMAKQEIETLISTNWVSCSL